MNPDRDRPVPDSEATRRRPRSQPFGTRGHRSGCPPSDAPRRATRHAPPTWSSFSRGLRSRSRDRTTRSFAVNRTTSMRRTSHDVTLPAIRSSRARVMGRLIPGDAREDGRGSDVGHAVAQPRRGKRAGHTWGSRRRSVRILPDSETPRRAEGRPPRGFTVGPDPRPGPTECWTYGRYGLLPP